MAEKRWVCCCISNDCNMYVFGPYLTQERAEAESQVDCESAHVTNYVTKEWFINARIQQDKYYSSSWMMEEMSSSWDAGLEG